MKYARMAMEKESPEQIGYGSIAYNLSESSVRDRTLGEVGVQLPDLVLFYGDHIGHPKFRERIATQTGGRIGPEDILVTAGAAHALFIIATTLLEPGDHVVVVRPNYATNIEVPRSIGANVAYYDLTFEEGYRIDIDRLGSMITSETRYVNLTVPHNPTGEMISAAELEAAVDLVEQNESILLMDETYREMTYGEMLPVAATLSDRAVSVSSVSKAYGIPGIRVGWLTCRDERLMERFLSAKEQIGICNSVVDEEIAAQAYQLREAWLQVVGGRIADALGVMKDWIGREELVEWIEPRGGVVCFPRIKADVPVDVDEFYRVLLSEHGTYVGPGHWFEQSRRSFRIGFGWPTLDELRKGLSGISASIRTAIH